MIVIRVFGKDENIRGVQTEKLTEEVMELASKHREGEDVQVAVTQDELQMVGGNAIIGQIFYPIDAPQRIEFANTVARHLRKYFLTPAMVGFQVLVVGDIIELRPDASASWSVREPTRARVLEVSVGHLGVRLEADGGGPVQVHVPWSKVGKGWWPII